MSEFTREEIIEQFEKEIERLHNKNQNLYKLLAEHKAYINILEEKMRKVEKILKSGK